MARAHILAVALVSTFVADSPAQIGGDGSDGVLTVVGSVTLNADTRPNGFNFQAITVSTGSTLTLVGSLPAILRSQGPVRIDGTVSADANGAAGGPGGYNGGAPGFAGGGPGGGAGATGTCQVPSFPGWGLHYTVYGSAYPFDLRGGSGGGGYDHRLGGCVRFSYFGGGGGGTLVVLSDGTIDVTGTVSAGGTRQSGGGAGGSILLRSATSLRVTGAVSATGANPLGGSDGFVRLDGAQHQHSGVVTPAPTILVLPRLRAVTPLTIGQTATLRSDATVGDDVYVFVAAARASIPLPPFGILELDPSSIVLLGQTRAAVRAGTEQWSELLLAVPNDRALRGSALYLQSLAWAARTQTGRLGNSIDAVIQ